jgi:hypothetical protein
MGKLTEADRLTIAKRLAVLDRHVVIGVREVAVIYNTSVAAVQQACSAMRVARGDVGLVLPPRLQGLGRRVGWLHGDVRDFLANGRPQSAVTAPAPMQADQAPLSTQGGSRDEASRTRMGRKRHA